MARKKKTHRPAKQKYEIVEAGPVGADGSGGIQELIEKLTGAGAGRRSRQPVIIIVNNDNGGRGRARTYGQAVTELGQKEAGRDKLSGFQELGNLCDTPDD